MADVCLALSVSHENGSVSWSWTILPGSECCLQRFSVPKSVPWQLCTAVLLRDGLFPRCSQVEQLHKIFKLCGSPSDDYWRRSRLPHATIFKPQQPYKRCLRETYAAFPPAALALLDVLLAIEPGQRGTATQALKHEVTAPAVPRAGSQKGESVHSTFARTAPRFFKLRGGMIFESSHSTCVLQTRHVVLLMCLK